MATPPNFEKGQSTYRPPRFNGQYYGWWKTRMHDFIMAEDSELWDVICDGPHVPMKKLGETGPMNFRAKKILVCGIRPDEYNRISACDSAKEIWEALQTAHEGTTQVKQSKIDMLTTENKLVRKVLSVLPGSWESKVNVITEAKDLQTLTMDELIGNLKTYKMKRQRDSERREPKKEKNSVLKAKNNDSSEEDSDMTYLTKRFQKMGQRNGGIPKRGSTSKPRNYDLYHKCGNPGHFIKDYPLLKYEHYKQNSDKAAKRNLVPNKRFSQKSAADNVVKQALAAWGDSSSESEGEPDAENRSMMAVEHEAKEYDSLFALIAQSDDDEEDDNDELGDAKQSREDLVVCVVDLNETIANLEKEKEALTEKINSVENERDDLTVVVVDLKETIKNLSKENNDLEEKTVDTEQAGDDFLVVITDLEETIEGLKSEHRHVSIEKGKGVASETHIKLEKELNDVRTSLCGELEKNRQLQAKLKKVKIDLEKSLKWTWS
ncbi:uncharacterized protein [Nicotiana sylvestris]|uniref:uncharacterized protein n=1 Tax=Nicotiana sylvestris TaxID=4096 RepID=UPI00388C94D0